MANKAGMDLDSENCTCKNEAKTLNDLFSHVPSLNSFGLKFGSIFRRIVSSKEQPLVVEKTRLGQEK